MQQLSGLLRTIALGIFLLSANGLVAAALAQDQPTDDLATILNRIATETDVEILFAPEIVAQKVPASTTIEGTPSDTLARVLSGTGLAAEQTSPDVFVIKLAALLAQSAQESASSAASQTAGTGPAAASGFGAVEGRIVSAVGGAGLAGASIRLEGTGLDTTTDQRGFFRFSTVPAGEYRLTVFYIGADAISETVTVTADGATELSLSMTLRGVDTIYVYGTRSSFLQSLNQQKNAENNQTVVSADLLGTFPAETVAEALRRVPGITFELDDATGEGNKVSVRGISPEGINIQLNGLQLQGTGIERAVDLTGFLADNISQITIQKSLLPEYEGTGNGGLIEIETKSALDYGERHLSFGIEREFSGDSEFGDETQFNLSGVMQINDRFAIGANGQFRNTGRRNYGTTVVGALPPVLPAGFTSTFRLPFTFNFPFDAAFDQRLTTGTNYTVNDREVDTWTGSVFSALDLGESTRLRFEFQRIDNEDLSLSQRTTVSTLSSSIDMPVPELGGEERRRTYYRSFRPTNGVSSEEKSTITDVFSIRGETFLNRWTLDYDVGLSRTRDQRLSYTVNTLSDQNTDVFNLFDANAYTVTPDSNGVDRIVDGVFGVTADQIQVLRLTDAGRQFFQDPESYYIASAIESQRENESENASLRFKAQYDFGEDLLRNVKFGVQYNDVERTNSDDVLSNTNIPTSQSYVRIGTTRQTLGSFGADAFQLFNLGSINAPGALGAAPAQGSAQSLFQQIAAFELANPGSYRLTDNLVDPSVSAGALSTALTTEELIAAFVQSEWSFGPVTVTGGVRFESGDYVGNAISSPSIRQADGVFVDRNSLFDVGLIDFFDNSASADKVLPSLVATWRPNDRWVGRFAYNRTIFNPDVRSINRPQALIFDLRPTQNRVTIREGNPDLEQTISDNFEIGIDYYVPGRPAYVKAAYFYKDIEDNFTNVNLADVPADIEDRARAILTPLDASFTGLLDSLNADTEYLLQRPENGDGGQIQGVELEGATNLDFFPDSWPAFLKDIQLLGNVTWTDANFATLVNARDENGDAFQLTIDRPLANQAEWAGNLSVAYQTGGFSGRLLYTYQSERVRFYDEFNLNTVIPDFDTLDLIATYATEFFDTQYMFFFEADNLLRGQSDALASEGIGSFGGEGSPDFFFPRALLIDGGRTFTVGVRATF
ncbi:MAG: TonB-dependent receptor [Pseudomonadota bacterium]